MTDKAKRCVEALRFKEDFECIECPIPAGNCEENCMLDVAADLIESLAAELEQVKRERDAAVEDISRECHKCKHFKVLFNGCTPDYDCDHSDVCRDNDHWQWCGVKEDSK